MATNNRFSMYSNASSALGGPRLSNPTTQQSTQLSTTTLLNAVHNTYTSAQPYKLDASTSLVVNSWVTAAQVAQVGGTGGTVDTELALRAWEHARRRAEDGCIVLGSLHESTPSIFAPFLATLPLPIPSSVYTALNTIRPFIHSASPKNPAYPQHSALGITFTFTLAGTLTGASMALSQGGIATGRGLLNIPEDAGYRAFDVFYYLLTSASTPAEREFLNLQHPSTYVLLARSKTYEPPSFLPTADDAASADDFRAGLKAIGIKGASHRDLLSILAGLLKLGDTLTSDFDSDELEEVCEEVGGLLGLESEVLAEQCTTVERGTLIGGLYEALVDWVILKANEAIRAEISSEKDSDSSQEGASGFRTPRTDEDTGDTVCVTILEIPDIILAKAAAMRGVFDDTQGINLEMKEDGVDVVTAGSSVLREMENAVADVAPDLGIMTGPAGREREHEKEKRESILEKVGHEAEDGGFLKRLLFPVAGEGVSLGRTGRIDLPALLASSRVWYHLSLHPTDELPASLVNMSASATWSAGAVSRQLRSWRLPEWANRRNKNLDFTADFDHDEFSQRFAFLGCKDGKDGIESWIMERGWSNGEVVIGTERVWMREGAWWEAESMLDLKPVELPHYATDEQTGYSDLAPNGSGFFPSMQDLPNANDQLLGGRSRTPMAKSVLGGMTTNTRMTSGGDYGLGYKGDNKKGHSYFDHELGEYVNDLDPEIAEPKMITTSTISFSRRIWVAVVWALTFWIPSFVLRYVGRMRRPDVRMAWREKLVLVFFIFILNGLIIFYIIFFGKLLCPNFDKAWNALEVSEHQGDNDFYVSLKGHVYDISTFWKISHGDANMITSQAEMQPFGGLNLDEYFVPPLNQACPGLNIDKTIQMIANTSVTYPNGLHTSGYYQPVITSALRSETWYWDVFQPAIKPYYKGDLVVANSDIANNGVNGINNWAILNGKIYDLTDYFYTLGVENNLVSFAFLDDSMSSLVKMYPGTDITDRFNKLLAAADATEHTILQDNLICWDQMFYAGIPDFRQSAKCQVNNYILLAFTIILCAVILTKFLAALQFGSKRVPVQQDKFVICQVPAYTEGEESLRKALDSLTALQYDNKRKLICVICDGMIIGGGNDRPTPKIVLDILGVDPKIDPPALPFHSIGQSSEQLNYGKVYSGLYEYEGNVVPYLVIVKVGKESEQTKSKPGNRGKRDSQILLMSFLNRVHHRSPMNPLELEMFHQINNIIGVDPELYEYMLMVDADTSVREDSLNRLVAKCANDNKIAGICGETSLENEGRSWWTMIQVYEYFISHHLAKAFESLFGSVTCLPGCFTMYRLRSADKGKPLLISDAVIHEYADCNVDTLHKKNLLSLGEDRFLTTLMTKHFPYMSYKFIPDAYASTAAPETWSVLLSQRRRWINSTIHNLAELVWLPDMCGFCCFSMRFVVFIDLFGTLILPATCGYLGYLIYEVATRQGQFPLISIIMIAAVYGLQALIFLLKRQWQHIGWMIIYVIAFPIYSFVLPVYSFWNQDNFSWGNTRIVIGEKGNTQVVAIDDEGFDPRSIPLQRWDEYAMGNSLPGRRGVAAPEKNMDNPYEDTYEMDEMKSMYSSIKPSTILTGFPGRGQQYMTPQSPAPFAQSPGQMHRQSVYSAAPTNPFFENQVAQNASRHQSMMSFGGNNGMQGTTSPYQDAPLAHNASYRPSMSHLPTGGSGDFLASPLQNPHLRSQSNLGYASGAPAPLGLDPMGQAPRPVSMFTTLPGASLSRNEFGRSSTPMAFDFQNGNPNGRTGPTDAQIIEAIKGCLAEVDLDTVTKKQVRALVEQRLQCELVGESRGVLDRGIDEELAMM